MYREQRAEQRRLDRIVEIVTEGISCNEQFPPEKLRDEFEGGVARIMKTLGITRPNGTIDAAFTYEFCIAQKKPKETFYGFYFSGGSCLDGGSRNDECMNGCELASVCPSCFDLNNYKEECGE